VGEASGNNRAGDREPSNPLDAQGLIDVIALAAVLVLLKREELRLDAKPASRLAPDQELAA
jgi:hypothetical protein